MVFDFMPLYTKDMQFNIFCILLLLCKSKIKLINLTTWVLLTIQLFEFKTKIALLGALGMALLFNYKEIDWNIDNTIIDVFLVLAISIWIFSVNDIVYFC